MLYIFFIAITNTVATATIYFVCVLQLRAVAAIAASS